MVLHILETLKKPNKAFLKIKAIRKQLESFKVNPISISINENESERFHKNLFQDFLKTTSNDPIYSSNTLGQNFSMASIAETLICKKIEVKTPYYQFIRIYQSYSPNKK